MVTNDSVTLLPEGLSPILEATSALRSSAEAGRWEEMATIEKRRGEMLRRLCDGPVRSERIGALSAALAEIRDSDREVLSVLEEVRLQLGNALSEIGQGRRAIAAYQRTREDV